MNSCHQFGRPFFVVLALLLAWSVVGCSHDDSGYRLQLTSTETMIAAGDFLPIKMTDNFRSAWSSSIRNGLDFNAGLARMKTAMQKVDGKDGKTDDWFAMLERERADTQKAMAALTEPPPKYRDAHAKLVEMYGLYERLCSLAASPQGSFQTYGVECSEIVSKLEVMDSQFKVLVPQQP